MSSSSRDDLPIAVLDSGMGGLTVLAQLKKVLPLENFLYVEEKKHRPLGDKEASFLLRLRTERIDALLKKAKLVVLACHTLSTVAPLDPSLPVISMVEATVAACGEQKGSLAILATASTIASGVYQARLQGQIFPLACPTFVPLVEGGAGDPREICRKALHPLPPVDRALLACTHFPFLRKPIQEALGPHVELIDPAIFVAQETKRYCQNHFPLQKTRNHETLAKEIT